jgi:hypothetical protein
MRKNPSRHSEPLDKDNTPQNLRNWQLEIATETVTVTATATATASNYN